MPNPTSHYPPATSTPRTIFETLSSKAQRATLAAALTTARAADATLLPSELLHLLLAVQHNNHAAARIAHVHEDLYALYPPGGRNAVLALSTWQGLQPAFLARPPYVPPTRSTSAIVQRDQATAEIAALLNI